MKHALVIGASGGIGGATARALAGSYDLTLVGRDGAALRRLRDELGGRAVPTDVANELEVDALFAELPAVDLLVYAAGAVRTGPLAELDGAALREVIDANLTGLALTLAHATSRLTDGARVFVLGARPELVSVRGFAAYAAAKAAAATLVHVAAKELRGARLTLVLPGPVDTRFWRDVGPVPRQAVAPEVIARAIVDAAADASPPSELRVP